MSTVSANTILDATGGNTATINGTTPTAYNTMGKNRIINGAMEIDQRALGTTTINSDAAWIYTLDRWNSVGQTSAGVFTVQQSSTSPAGFTKSFLATVTTSSTPGANALYIIRQVIEGYNCADLAWGTSDAKTITFSFYVRSSVTGTFAGVLKNQPENRSYAFTYTINSADTWEKKSVTIAGDTSGTWLTTNGSGMNVYFSIGAGSSRVGTPGSWGNTNLYGATGQTNLIETNGATFYITGVQLEVGSVATEFERRPFGTELQLCQRYYEYGKSWAGPRYSDSAALMYGAFKATKRAIPTMTYLSISGGTPATNTADVSEILFYCSSAQNSDGRAWWYATAEL
jgi:hypothetical protein